MRKNVVQRSIKRFFTTPLNPFLIFLIIVFSIGSPYFFSFKNFYNIFLQGATIGIMALGLSFVIMNGNIDLSVGSLLGLCSGIFVVFANQYSIGMAILAALVVGAAIGAWNGFCVWKLKINAFIVTLASMIGVRGLLFIVTKENSISLADFSFTNFASFNILGLSAISWIYILLALVLVLVQRYTVHGRNVMYVGGNTSAARAAGINSGAHQFINFIICSTCVGLAAILFTAQLGSATPNSGRQYELWAIASVALGGVKLIGGVGKVGLVFLGGITIAVLRNGMSLLRLNTAYVFIVTGLVLLLVMVLSQYMEYIQFYFNKRMNNFKKNKVDSNEESIRSKKN